MSENPRGAWKSLVFAGLLPVIAFTLIEEYYGTWWGLVAGLAFGLGEIVTEYVRERRVRGFTWFGNGLLLALGGVSLLTDDGIWFKMQPALMEGAIAAALWFFLLIGRDPLRWLMESQGHAVPGPLLPYLKGLCFRIGVFFALQAVLAVHAALHWSTEAWALLKGIGLTVGFVIYMGIEFLVLRRRVVSR